MKALILTYDRQISFANLVIESYNHLWPDNGFEWIVPFNNKKPNFTTNKNVNFIQSPSMIRSTVERLLHGLPNDEFVFWAFDDVYPRKIVDIDTLKASRDLIYNGKPNRFDSIRIAHSIANPNSWKGEKVDINGTKYIHKNGFGSFWFHQFINVKTLKKIFLNNRLKHNYSIRQVNSFPPHKVFMPTKKICFFGETARHSAMTKNAYDDLKKYGIKIPKMSFMKTVVIVDNHTKAGKNELRLVARGHKPPVIS